MKLEDSKASERSELHHAAHAAHVMTVIMATSRLFLFRNVGDHTLGSEQHARDRGGILKGSAGDLGWVKNTSLYEVFILVSCDIVAFITATI